MKTLTALALCVFGLVTGCAAAKPVAMTPVAAEPDPWQGFTNGYGTPEAKAEPKAEAKPEKTEKTEKTEPVADNSDAEDVAPQPVKKVGKKKAKKAKKATSGSVAGKKPRKRAKRTS